MWPFKKKKPPTDMAGVIQAADEIVDMMRAIKEETREKVDVGKVTFVLVLDTGEREDFVVVGKVLKDKTVIRAMEIAQSTIARSHEMGFFGFGKEGQYARWIPTRRVMEVLTTEWPYEVPVK